LKETGTVENPYRYAGYRYDKETGLYYLQSRYYNPEMGRFLTRDVFEGFLNETLSVNKYVYTENNPVMSIDPDGYWKKTIYLSKKTMWKILATGAGIGVVLAAAGGWWVLAAAILVPLQERSIYFLAPESDGAVFRLHSNIVVSSLRWRNDLSLSEKTINVSRWGTRLYSSLWWICMDR